jgi:hypothetical protein
MDLLLPGDVFATRNPNGLGKAICLAEKLKSPDGKAEYGHTGIIQDAQGKTLEAVWTIAEQNLFEAYKGDRVLIARFAESENAWTLRKGFEAVCPLKNRMYPFHRLLLHAIGLARWIHWMKTPVCSELTAMFLVNTGVPMSFGGNYWGITPDNLVDEWRISKHFDIIFEGELK